MSDINDIVKLAVDAHNGRVEKYSVNEAQDVLRQELIERNNGKDHLDYRDLRDGKCNGVFTLIEQVLDSSIQSGLSANDFFNSYIDYKNVARGDKNEFIVRDNDYFVVSTVADGTQGIRRQRLIDKEPIAINTQMHMVRIYEELDRVLAGKVDFNYLIDRVGESYNQKILEDCINMWTSISQADLGAKFFPTAGAYDENALLDLVANVEAAADGATATIVGTKKALRNVKESIDSNDGRNELHNFGVYGHFYGTPVVAIPQKYKTGTTEFAYDDNVITVIAGDDKPVKFVYEGDPIIIPGDPMQNADLTQEYLYGVRYGLGIVVAGNSGIGKYQFA